VIGDHGLSIATQVGYLSIATGAGAFFFCRYLTLAWD
jgi:hypothetical protein